MEDKPRVFIASSSESLPYAEAVFSHLEKVAEPSLWSYEMFAPMRTNIENLERIINRSDYGVVLFSPDDLRVMRNSSSPVPRDNIVFELGLIMGQLGRDRVFVLESEEQPIGVPTDLYGLTYLRYNRRSDGNHFAAVATACRRVSDVISKQRSRRDRSLEIPFWNNVQERHRSKQDMRCLIEDSHERIFVSGISLKYMVGFCRRQLIAALQRGVIVEVLIPSIETVDEGYYELYKSHAKEEVVLAQGRWREFSEFLDDETRARLKVTTTPLILMHSIGIYDRPMYVNPFCAGLDSTDLPSYRLDPNVPAYAAYVRDALEHLAAGSHLCGGREQTFLNELPSIARAI